MARNLEEQIKCAKKAGFVFKPPMLRIVKLASTNWATPHGYAYMHLNIIILAPYASYDTMAHELGHIVDAQTGRQGHPFFDNKKNWDKQNLADAVKEVVLKECYSARYGG
ncbi:MAG: hypothetical protein Q8R34_01635 [bacterium]|nr:hypothetical protein [bacterium]